MTRLKTNARYEVMEDREITTPGQVLADEVLRFTSEHGRTAYPEPLRRVHYRDPETGKQCVFLTSRLDFSALEIAALYRRRWQIDLFFNTKLPSKR